MPRPGFTFPAVDFFKDLPATALAGSCFTRDRRGVDTSPYVYILVPTNGTGVNAATFWRLNVLTGSLVQLATPAFDANAIIGNGTAMCYDESLGTVMLIHPQATAGAATVDWACWRRYTIATNVWDDLDTATLNLAAPLGTDVALLHPDARVAIGAAVGGQAQDDGFYLVGNGAVTLYRYNLTGGTNWTTLAPGAARAAAPGAGVTLLWNAYNTDVLLSHRGGGSTVIDSYAIQANNWAALAAPAPPIAVTTGCEYFSTYNLSDSSLVSVLGKIYVYSHRNNSYISLCEIDGADGGAHTGNGMVHYTVGDRNYICIRPHSGKVIQRIRPIL